MLWNREQYLAYMADFQDIGRPFFAELFGPLKPLEAEWRAQGASEEEISLDAFGFDGVDYAWAPANTGIKPLPTRVLERTADYEITMDAYGRQSKLCFASATIPLPIEFPVKTPEDWERIKPRYLFDENRIDTEAFRELKRRRDAGALIMMGVPGGYDEPRVLMGEADYCVALYDEPEMIEDMLATFAETSKKVLERVSQVCPVDLLFFHEDMAGRSGPLIGPNMVKKFLQPYYSSLIEAAKSQGARLFSQDSDGNMNPVISAFLDCGINCMHPFEPQAGMNMVQTRREYGHRLGIKGGLDKFALLRGKEAIRAELEAKLVPEMLHGGTVIGLDHRIPNGVKLEDYRYYVATAREMLGLEPAHFEKHIRMAF